MSLPDLSHTTRGVSRAHLVNYVLRGLSRDERIVAVAAADTDRHGWEMIHTATCVGSNLRAHGRCDKSARSQLAKLTAWETRWFIWALLVARAA